jgi:hypothetical protein
MSSKLMCTETISLTKSQRTYLKRIKKPKSFDTKSLDDKDKEPSPNTNYEALPEQPTPMSHPSSQVPPHKRDREDEFQPDQPTHKQPRQLLPSVNISSDSEPQQPESPTPNKEDSTSTPNLTIESKCQQQEDNTHVNKKQKCQENAELLTNTEPPLLRAILPSDPAPAPTDSLLESLMIPTPNQMIPQSQTIEPTPGETAPDIPNQESMVTVAHGFAHHSPTTETPAQSQPPPQKPSSWNGMSKSQRRNWLRHQLGN